MKIQYKNAELTVIVAVMGLLFIPCSRAQESAEPHLGAYGKASTYCGADAAPRNEPSIPQVGCFYLSAGHRATGTFATHLVEVTVNTAGAEIFKVDGHVVVETQGTATSTNLPYVKVGGVAGYSICKGQTDRASGCPSSITVFSRDPDKVVLFVVSECLPPKYSLCVTTQENWDYEKAHLH
jgi:hypothetical protein